MSKHGTARSQAGNATLLSKKEIREYNRALLVQGKVLLHHPEVVRNVLKSPDKVGQILHTLIPSKDPHVAARKQWEAFYLKYFGLSVDFSGVAIPKPQDGFSRLVIVAQGVTLNAAMAACKKHFPTWQYYDDLDKDVVHNDRTADGGAYAIWFRDRIEADEETDNQSADDLASQGAKGITLLERILMELEYFGRTGQHLDIQNVTLCSGSRYRGGYVPRACWGGKFCVYWCGVQHRHPDLRARVAGS